MNMQYMYEKSKCLENIKKEFHFFFVCNKLCLYTECSELDSRNNQEQKENCENKKFYSSDDDIYIDGNHIKATSIMKKYDGEEEAEQQSL